MIFIGGLANESFRGRVFSIDDVHDEYLEAMCRSGLQNGRWIVAREMTKTS